MSSYCSWITLAEQYIKTSKLIMEQIVANQNKWFMIDDKPIELEQYFEETKWSDFNTLVPSLFLLIHGLELLLKGIAIWCGKTPKYEHNTANLIDLIKGDPRINSEFINIVCRYVGEKPSNRLIVKFLKINNFCADSLHIDIRYPENKYKLTDFSLLRYKEKHIIKDIECIIKDIDKLYRLALKIIRQSEISQADENFT
jgi:hypothetical protein